MGGIRLRTKFLLSMVVVSAALTFTTLLVVRHTVQQEVRLGIQRDLQNSVSAFQNFQKQREVDARAFGGAAGRPAQCARADDHARCGDHSGRIARFVATVGQRLAPAGRFFRKSDGAAGDAAGDHRSPGAGIFPPWCRAKRPGTGGTWKDISTKSSSRIFILVPASERQVLGYLVLGYEIDDRVARDLSRVAASEVVFRYGDAIVRSTLKPSQEAELLRVPPRTAAGARPKGIRSGWARNDSWPPRWICQRPVTPALSLWVLKSFDQATAFLRSLNELLLALGLDGGAGRKPAGFLDLAHLHPSAGEPGGGSARAGAGGLCYPLQARGGDEVAEVTGAFDRMRTNLQKTHRELLDAERLATIGRMASSISHDLRHSLAAVVANAEFLCESNLTPGQREDLYAEIRIGVNQMTELIESLLEFSRTRESLRPTYGDVRSAVERAVQGVKAHPEFQRIRIRISGEGSTEGWFDFKKAGARLAELAAERLRGGAGGNRENRHRAAAQGRESGDSHRG